VSPPLYDQTALHVSSLRGDVAIVEKLLAKGADPNAGQDSADTPLRYDTRAICHTLQLGRSEPRGGLSSRVCFRLAVESGVTGVVEALLRAGAGVNARSPSDGSTPLHAAVKAGNLPMVQVKKHKERRTP
jgi:ankyrin repeat protein